MNSAYLWLAFDCIAFLSKVETVLIILCVHFVDTLIARPIPGLSDAIELTIKNLCICRPMLRIVISWCPMYNVLRQ